MGHYYPLTGITLSPIVLLITTSIVVFGISRSSSYFISFLAYFFVALHDILTRLYAGGNHDVEGQGIAVLFLIMGAFLSVVMLLAGYFIRFPKEGKANAQAVGLFVLLIVFHLYLLGDFGLDRQHLR